MGNTLASLFVALGLNSRGFGEGLVGARLSVREFANSGASDFSSMSSSMRHVEGDAEKLQNRMSAFGGALKTATMIGALGLVAMGAETIHLAGDFERQMTRLVTDAGEAAGPKGIGLVNSAILEMAGEVGRTPQQLAEGMYLIESAGFHGAAGVKVLHASAIAASVGMADFKDTADAVTSALNAYGMQGDQAQHVTDILLQTTAEGKMEFGQLASSISAVLPIAAASGVSLSEVGSAMATMTAEGMSAQNAAQNLRMSITALESPNSQAAKTMKSLGLSAQELQDKMKSGPGGLADAFQAITDAVGKKFPAGSAEYMSALKDIMGGTHNMQALLLLTGTHMAALRANIDGMNDASKGAGKTMSAWKDAQNDFNVTLQRLQGGLEAVGIRIGTQLMPEANRALQWVNSIVADVNEGIPVWVSLENHLGAIGPLLGAIVSVVQFLASNMQVVGPILIVLVSGFIAFRTALMIQGIISSVAGAMTMLRAVMIFLSTGEWAAATASDALAISELAALWPLLLIVVAVMAVIAVIVLLVTHWKQVTEVATIVWNAIQGFGEFLLSWFVGVWNTLVEVVEHAAHEIMSRPIYYLTLLVLAGPILIAMLVLKSFQLFNWLVDQVSSLIARLVPWVIGQLWSMAQQAPGAIWAMASWVWGAMGGVWNAVTTALWNILNWARGVDWGSIGWAIINGIKNALYSGASQALAAMRDIASQMLNAAKSALGIGSPSRVFAEQVGKPIMQGVALGIGSDGSAEDAMAGAWGRLIRPRQWTHISAPNANRERRVEGGTIWGGRDRTEDLLNDIKAYLAKMSGESGTVGSMSAYTRTGSQ